MSSLLRPGLVLETPSGRADFLIESVGTEDITIRVGEGRWPINIPWRCLDRIERELPGKGWVRVGGMHGDPEEGTLESIIQSFTHGTSAASYVAPILEHCGVAEIDRDVPHKIRLV